MIALILFILLIITIAGIVLIRSSTYENRLFILIPSGMVWGVSVYIFLLNLNAKFLPGRNGIILSTLFLISLAIFAHILIKSKKIKLPKLINFLILASLVLMVVYLARLKMTSVFPVADSDMQWAYAASFARGNYPVKTPWQPDLNPNYHLGAYFLEGAILSISGLPFITIHAILNTFFLIAGSLFAIFIFWDEGYYFKNIWLILATLILYISFGVIIFIFPTQDFFKGFNLSEVLLAITRLPQNIPAKGMGGASLVDLNALSYLPARSLSLGLAFLALYFTFTPFKNYRLKILSFVLLFSVIALVEESMFLPIFLTFLLIFILSFLNFSYFENIKRYRNFFFSTLFFTTIVIFTQGGFASDLLDQKGSAFSIFLPYSQSFLDKLKLLESYTITSASKSFNLILPSPVLLALTVLIYSLIYRKKDLSLISLYSLIAFFCYLSIEYKYSPSTNIRFHSFSYISTALGFIYLIFTLMKDKSNLQNMLVLSIVICMITPSFLPEILNQSQQIKEAGIKNYRSQILISTNPSTPFENISNWANKNLPLNSRLLVVDTDQPTPKRSIQFQYKGLYTVLGPQYIHTNRPEPGPEYFDLALTLNPSLLKQTKTDYIYIESESVVYQQLPQFRKDQLSNNTYFQTLISIDTKDNSGKNIFYRLYKVKSNFLNDDNYKEEIREKTLQQLQNLIPDKASVYIADYGRESNLSFWYRMASILALKNKDIRRNLSQTDYQIIETTITYKSGKADEKYDFYILAPDKKPSIPSKLIWSNIFASAWKAY